MTKRNRLVTSIRKDQVLAAALAQAAIHGFNRVTRDQIAVAAGCSPGLVSHHGGTMVNLRRSIVRAAVTQEHLVVLAQALAAGDEHARRAPDALKTRAMENAIHAV